MTQKEMRELYRYDKPDIKLCSCGYPKLTLAALLESKRGGQLAGTWGESIHAKCAACGQIAEFAWSAYVEAERQSHLQKGTRVQYRDRSGIITQRCDEDGTAMVLFTDGEEDSISFSALRMLA